MAEIRVGTSGYSFPDWVGTVYPRELPQKAWLSYYARWFSAVEINSTYYRIPSPYMMAALVRKVPKGFLFTVKVPKEMTHERGKFEEVVGPFLAAIAPMVQAGCLASLLAQFPYSLPRGDPLESLSYLVRLREAIPPEIPVHVEFRHAFWYKPEVLDFLAAHDLGFVNVDLPQLPGLPPIKTSFATNRIGYVRFHGRNAAKWWEHEEAGERYDYEYSREELSEWVPQIRELADRTKITFLFMNNCHLGKSVKDAIKMMELLEIPLPEGPLPGEEEGKLIH